MLLVYHFVAIIVLVNMLIAMMSNSFQTIQNHADIEWKFARSKLWMGYFDEGCTLPPPFNTIISPKSMYYTLRGFKNLICKLFCSNIMRRKQAETRNKIAGSIKMPAYNGDASNANRRRVSPTYTEVMHRLVNRYIHLSNKHKREDGVNEDDLLEIKQDISSLRFELREDRKREVMRSTGQIDSIKHDLIRTLSKESRKSVVDVRPPASLQDQNHGGPMDIRIRHLNPSVQRPVPSVIRETDEQTANSNFSSPSVRHQPLGSAFPTPASNSPRKDFTYTRIEHRPPQTQHIQPSIVSLADLATAKKELLQEIRADIREEIQSATHELVSSFYASQYSSATVVADINS